VRGRGTLGVRADWPKRRSCGARGARRRSVIGRSDPAQAVGRHRPEASRLMARSILVVESDFDALGALASKLRMRGLEVAIADSVASAVDRARAAPPEAVIVAAEILSGGGFKAKFAADPVLARVMIFTLYSVLPERELHADELDANEFEDIVRRMHAS